VQALDTVQDVAEAAHLGGLITQEWSETFEFGDAQRQLRSISVISLNRFRRPMTCRSKT
jgi:hypothetical protein